jgi:hypothetical protein
MSCKYWRWNAVRCHTIAVLLEPNDVFILGSCGSYKCDASLTSANAEIRLTKVFPGACISTTAYANGKKMICVTV